MALQAIVNSTLVANFKTFFGRYAGTEGNLKTEVVDVNLLEIPDPRRVTPAVARKLEEAFAQLCQRDTGPMVEEEFMDCHSIERARKLAEWPISLPAELRQPDRRALDLAVFELLGVASAREREALCDELYRETAAHFRQIRLVEIQKQKQRARAEGREFRTDELAADLWDALTVDERQPVAEWLAAQTRGGGARFVIPEGRPNLPDAGDFLDAATVFFRRQAGANRCPCACLHAPTRRLCSRWPGWVCTGRFACPKANRTPPRCGPLWTRGWLLSASGRSSWPAAVPVMKAVLATSPGCWNTG